MYPSSRRKLALPGSSETGVEPKAGPIGWERVREIVAEEQSRRGRRPDTIRHHEQNLSAIFKLIPQDENVLTMTSEKYQKYVFDEYRRRGLRPVTTINGRIKSLEMAYDVLISRGYVRHNVVREIPKMLGSEPEILSLTNEQTKLLLMQPKLSTYTGYRDRTMMELVLDNGVRLREMMDLTVEQVDIPHRTLRRVLGKNGKIEDLPLSKPMCRRLEKYLEIRGTVATFSLFVTVDNSPFSRRTWQERLREYGLRAGITDVRVSPHTLRHTFAKNWILGGGDIFSLQRVLRHSTMDMVRRYVNLWAHEIRDRHDKFSPLVQMSAMSSWVA